MDKPPDCKYKNICKYYKDWCNPGQFADYMSTCWRKNFFDSVIKEGTLEIIIKEVENERT